MSREVLGQSRIICELTVGHRYGPDGFQGQKRSQGGGIISHKALDPDE